VRHPRALIIVVVLVAVAAAAVVARVAEVVVEYSGTRQSIRRSHSYNRPWRRNNCSQCCELM